MIVVRRRVPEDLPALAEILATQAERSGYPIRWPWSGPTEEFIVRRNELRAWVAVVGEQPDHPVGHVSVVGIVDDDDGIAAGWTAATGASVEQLGCISVLYVDQELRGAGIASTLLDTATAWIQAEGLVPVLDVVSQHRGIVDLYARRGWREVGMAHPGWLPEASLVLMVLDGR